MAENLSWSAEDGRKQSNRRTTEHHIPGASEPHPSSSFKPPQSSSVSLYGSEPLPDQRACTTIENHEISKVEELQRVVDEFRTAHGLALLFSNKTGFEKDTPSIHNSSRAMSLAMGNLSFATIIYQDQKNNQYRDILKAISKVRFGASYKCIFIYCTGHGEKGYLKVTDGMFSIKEMKSILSPEKALSLKNMVIFIFWDCCRTIVNTREVLMTRTEDNLVIFYSVPINQQSLLDPTEGQSIATKELIKLILKPQKECSLFDLLTVKLTNKVKEAGWLLRTDFEGSVSHIIYPHKDKLMSMSPRNITVTENHDEDTCLISWEAPHHGDKYSLRGYSIRDENQTYIESDIRELKVTLSRSKVCNKKVTVCAHYDHLAEIKKGGEECVNEELVVDGHRDGECPLVSLRLDSRIPTNVQVTILPNGGGQLTWTKPIALQRNDFECVSIQRAPANSTEGEDAWKCVTEKSQVNDSSYEIVAIDSSRYKYRMRIHDGRMTTPWIPADKHEPDSRIPTNVQVTILPNGGGQLTWTKPIALRRNDFECVSVQRAPADSREDSWKYVTRRSWVNDSDYEIVAPNPSRYKYRMRIHDGRMSTPWIPADKHEPENLSCFKQIFVAKWILPFLFPITFFFFSAILYVAIAISLTQIDPSGYHLIVADEVPIDCDHLNWFQKMIYSHVFIKEEPNNFEHDYKPGFNITIWSEKKENFSISNSNWTFESNVTSPDKTFQIKNEKNDTFMWKNSNIYFETEKSVNFSNLHAFLIKGSINKQYFVDQPTLHWTEQNQNLSHNNIVNWYVRHNDYYYVFVIAELPDSVPFANFKTDVHYSTNECNGPNSSSTTIKRLDNEALHVKVAIDFLNRNRTLCRGIADSIHLKVKKTHLHLTYATRYEFVYAIPPPIALLITICIFIHFGCKYALCCICKQLVNQCYSQVKQWYLRRQQRRDYLLIQ